MIGKVDQNRVNKHTTFLINNNYSSDTQKIANHFNEYFINVGSSLAKKYQWNRYCKGVLPLLITNLFALNNERHNYNTRPNHNLQINTGNGEIVYKRFSFHGVQIWNHIFKKKSN